MAYWTGIIRHVAENISVVPIARPDIDIVEPNFCPHFWIKRKPRIRTTYPSNSKKLNRSELWLTEVNQLETEPFEEMRSRSVFSVPKETETFES